LGAALTRALTESGFELFVNFSCNKERALRLQEETGCQLRRADVSDENCVQQMFESLPPLRAVIHAAAITRDALLLRQSPESWQKSMEVNLTGAFLVARQALQKVESGGRLIFLASRVGEHGASGQGAYAATKAATIALMKCAAYESAGRLSVNAICPPFVPSALSYTLDKKAITTLKKQSLNGQTGDVSSLIGVVRWLVSEEGAGVSGQVIHCDDRIL
jgi:3-oxoacyl-[acyl-carrier protein] reductase